MPTNYPAALDTTTELPNDQTDATATDRAGVDHAAEHVNLSDAVRAIEGELGTDPAGAQTTVKARLDVAGVGAVARFERATDFYMTSPMVYPFLSGSFTPEATSVVLEFFITHATYASEGATSSWELYYGLNGAAGGGQLTPKQQDVGLPSGVTQVGLGMSGSLRSNFSIKKRLTGLTAGVLHRFEISTAIVGGNNESSIHPTAPYRVDSAKGAGALIESPEWSAIIAMAMGADETVFISSRRFFDYGDDIIGAVRNPAANGGDVAITPDGTKAVRTSTFTAVPNQPVWVMDTGVPIKGKGGDDLGFPTIRSTILLPNSEVANNIAITPNGQRAWICIQGSAGRYSTIQPIDLTLATPVITTPNQAAGALGGVNANPSDIVIDAAGTYAYVAVGGAVTNTIRKVLLSDGTIAASATVINAGKAAAYLDLSPDGTTLCVVSADAAASNYTWQVRTSDLAITAGPTALLSSCVPTAVKYFSDGLSVVIASKEIAAGVGKQIYHWVPSTQLLYTAWPLTPGTGNHAAYDIDVGLYGDIWVPNNTDQSLSCWTGGQMRYAQTEPVPTVFDINAESYVEISPAT